MKLVGYYSSLLDVGLRLDLSHLHKVLSLLEKIYQDMFNYVCEGLSLLGPGDPSRERQSGVASPVTDTLDMALWLGEAGALLKCVKR